MPIPATRYINAGPIQAQANPGSAIAAGQAVAQVGEAIANVGEQGLEIVGRIRRVKEAGAINAFMAQADEAAGRFSIDLARRSDTDAWPQEWQDQTAKLKEQAKALGLSPDGAARLDNEFTNWSSTRAIHFETQAATTALGIAKSQTTQSLEYYAARADREGFDRTKREGVAGGILNPADVQAAETHFQAREADTTMDRMMEHDPQRFADMSADEILKTLPGATVEGVQQKQRQAKGLVKERSRDAGELAMDEVADNKLNDPEQLKTDPRFKGMRPVVREHIAAVMQERATDGYREKVATPEFQQQRFGEISQGISNYNAEDDNADLHLAQIDAAMRDVKPGFLRDKLEKQYRELVENKTLPESKTYGDFMLQQVDELNGAGRFGKTVKAADMPKLQTADLVKQGFLKDAEKLQRLGFSADQAEAIAKAASDPAAGQKAFIDGWKDRTGGSVKASAIELATANALRLGHPAIDWNDPAGEAAATTGNLSTAQKYGIAKMKLTEFLKLNPTATKEAIDSEFLKVTGEGIRAEAKAKFIAPKPMKGETSMTIPKGGLKLSNYGYASDTTPDSNSAKGIGHSDNKLIAGESAAISKSLADRLNLKHGDKIKIETTKGTFSVFYHDTVPATDSRTGDLPETIDIYRPKDGSNGWGGRVTKVSKI